jgi:hypothetical protein
MKLTCTDIEVTQNPITKKYRITLETMQNPVRDVQATQEIVKQGKELDVEIKQHREKRSLNANNYSWLLSDQLADALRISKEECHFLMLKRYGQKTVISVIKEGMDILTKAIEYYEQSGETELYGKMFYHFKIWKGSHDFDTREMSIFIDGIVDECKEQGIETMTPQELAALKCEWGR